MAVFSEILTHHEDTVYGKSVGFLNVKTGGTYSNHCVLRVRERKGILSLFSPRWLMGNQRYSSTGC
jgi:hypothetical protein